MKKNRLIGLVIGLVVVVAVAGSFLWWNSRVEWPIYSAAADNAPQVIAKVVPPARNQYIDQDYAYHVGDVVTVDIFARQQKDTLLDPATLSVGGDFELAEAPSVNRRENKDGTVDYRVRVKLQSFKPQRQLDLKATLAWKPVDGERKEVSIPKTSVFWSNTYDGQRKALKEGNEPRVPFYWYTMRYALPLALSALLFLTIVWLSVRNHLRNRPVEVDPAVAMARVNELISRIGSLSKAEHLELDGIVREHFGVGPVPASQLDGLRLEAVLVEFLKLNAPAVYAEDALSGGDASKLHLAAQRVLRRWNYNPSRLASKPTLVGPQNEGKDWRRS
jgi:hypothetical protein